MRADKLRRLRALAGALRHTLVPLAPVLLSQLAGLVLQSVASALEPEGSISPFLADRLALETGPDGIVLAGETAAAGMKFATRKGLPGPGEKRLLVENEPHTPMPSRKVVIEEGYGKGVKKVLWSGDALIKVGNSKRVALVEYCEHDADRAGLHYDLLISGVPAGEKQVEINIPGGDYRGRYAIVRTPRGYICQRMNDNSRLLAKPSYQLEPEGFLAAVDSSGEYLVTRKIDGSLGNAAVGKDGSTVFRSHRESARPYHDKLPALESIRNTSRLLSSRLLFPHPDLAGTVFQGELVHERGPAFTGGILNSSAPRARATQAKFGPVRYHVWDLRVYKGRDVSTLPFAERWELCRSAVRDIRLFNRDWKLVDTARPGKALEFYREVVATPGPMGEGVVVKKLSDPAGEKWQKVKATDLVDLEIVGFVEGRGKYTDALGTLVVRDPGSGGTGEIGTGFSDFERAWIWQNRDLLDGAVVKTRVFELTAKGSPRAGVFQGFHESKGPTEAGLLMYSEAAAGPGGDVLGTMYAMKSAAGWRR